MAGYLVEDAIRMNNVLCLRNDFVSKLEWYFGGEERGIVVGKRKFFDRWHVEKVAAYQAQSGLGVNGVVDGATRYALEEGFGLGLGEVGEVLFCGVSDGAALYDWCGEVICGIGGIFEKDCAGVQLLAIGGARIEGDCLVRVNRGSEVYDSVMFVLCEGRAECFQCSVNPGSVWYGVGDFDGTAYLCDGQYLYRCGRHGTSFLEHVRSIVEICDNEEEIFGVYGLQLERGVDLDYEGYVGIEKDGLSFVCYRGLVQKEAVEVYRQFRGVGELGVLRDEELRLSRKVVCNSFPSVAGLEEFFGVSVGEVGLERLLVMWGRRVEFVRYDEEECRLLFGVGSREVYEDWGESERMLRFYRIHGRYRDIYGDIGIHIHAGGVERRFSQGCQNIALWSYGDFIRRVYERVESSGDEIILYSVIDSRKLRGVNLPLYEISLK